MGGGTVVGPVPLVPAFPVAVFRRGSTTGIKRLHHPIKSSQSNLSVQVADADPLPSTQPWTGYQHHAHGRVGGFLSCVYGVPAPP